MSREQGIAAPAAGNRALWRRVRVGWAFLVLAVATLWALARVAVPS
jgi:hypothetical protein